MIRFDSTRHIYITASGRELCGITSVLRRAGLLPAVPPAPGALERGSRVHMAIAYDLDGDLDESSVDPSEMPYILAARQAIKELPLDIPRGASEVLVANEPAGYGTAIDAIGTWRGKRVAINWKSGPTAFPHYAIQTALEALCLPDPHERLGIHLLPDGKYRLRHYTDRNDFAVAKAAITLANWRSTHKMEESV